jgi:hypothetical protein
MFLVLCGCARGAHALESHTLCFALQLVNDVASVRQ